MRVVFLYVRDGASPSLEFDPKVSSTNFYGKRICEEGYYWMLRRMVETGIVDEVMVIIESGKGPGCLTYDCNGKIYGYVIPDIALLKDYVKPQDIIFVRGGFKTWHDRLVELQQQNHWMLIYAANTGREKWTFWDIIFNDLNGNNQTDSRSRFQFDFRKPINPNIFYPTKKLDKEFDLCIGASHIHDKKGQWRTIRALIEYKKIYGKNLKCVMPGAYRRGKHTQYIIDSLNTEDLDVYVPGMASRSQLNKIYNKSKFFIHLGGGGQGDRGPLEAMRCGTSVMVGNTERHSKNVWQNKKVCTVIPSDTDAGEIARILNYKVKNYNDKIKKYVYSYYEETSGVESIILPGMKKLFDIFRKYPVSNGKQNLLDFSSLLSK